MALELNTERLLSEGKLAPNTPITYEEFLEWSDDKTFAEWVGGEVLIMSPVSWPHHELSFFLSRALAEFAELHDVGQVATAPFQMHLANVQRGREPDVIFLTNETLSRLNHTHLEGPGDIVIEIVSPESALRDRNDKYREYESEGVREYWIIDPMAERVDFYILSADRRYERATLDANGKYHSNVLPGFWITVDWLWQRPLPSMARLRQEWAQTPNSDE